MARATVRDALARLKPRRRAVVVLHELEGTPAARMPQLPRDIVKDRASLKPGEFVVHLEYGIGHYTEDSESVKPRMMRLTGEGAYTGLSAMFQRRYEPDDTNFNNPVFEGYIFEHELTPMPDPVEPSAE